MKNIGHGLSIYAGNEVTFPLLYRSGDDSAIPRTICDCSQDQWDIYTLDPAYACVYKPRPETPTIIPNPSYTKNAPPEPSTSKRALSPVSPNSSDLPPHVHKKRRTDPKDEEDEVEQLLSSETPKRRPNPSQRARSKSRQPADGKPTPTVFTQPPLEPVQELHDTDMEDLAKVHTPANSRPTTAEKRKGTLSPLALVSHAHPSTKRASRRMKYIVQAHSVQISAPERNP